MLYTEGTGTDTSYQDCGTIARLHLAVNRDPADFPSGGPLNTLNDSHWWYYTGDGSVGTKAGPKYDLTTLPTPFQMYKGETVHTSPTITVRLPAMAFDEQAIIVTPSSLEAACTDGNRLTGDAIYEQYLFIIPRSHDGGTLSILDGDRPDESDITIIRMDSAPPIGSDRVRDDSDFFYAVQEPCPNLPAPAAPNQVENASFFINVIDRAADIQTQLRLTGLFDANPGAGVDWTLRQRVDLPSGFPDLVLLDMDVPSGLHFANPTQTTFCPLLPRTPDMATPDPWSPNAVGEIFHSAVLVRDTNGDHRIFATHAVQPAEEVGGSVVKTDQWVVQWYVINPHLDKFRASNPVEWRPTIEAAGRIPNDGDSYHPVIVVNRQGQAFIEYTYSDATPTGWPQLRRVRLTNSYTSVVPGSDILVRGGPSIAYAPGDPSTPGTIGTGGIIDDFWADYADAQADPFDNCRYWSTHTLVHDDTPPGPTEERDVWLFRQSYATNCFQSNAMLDLNDDDEVDSFDMLEFTPMFDRRARRVDVDGNGVVDATDAALFTNAYRGYTGR